MGVEQNLQHTGSRRPSDGHSNSITADALISECFSCKESSAACIKTNVFRSTGAEELAQLPESSNAYYIP